MRWIHLSIWLLAVLVLLGMSVAAEAHDPALSGIRVLYRRHDVVVSVTTHLSRLRQAEGRTSAVQMTTSELDKAIRRRLHLRFDGSDLVPAQANVILDNATDVLSWQTILPATVKECEVLSRIYPEDAQSRTVVIVLRDGVSVQETVLNADHPDWLKNQPKPRAWSVAVQFVREGILHILGGPDHIAFVLGLLLLGGSLKSLLRTVTAFTLAHSLTLTLAATGLLHPSSRIVEPLIALSIVAIAIENLRPRHGHQHGHGQEIPVEEKRDLRPYYAFGFGLIHGFGFAGALAEVGLPRTALGVALASFNVGVELAQAAIVLIVFPLLVWFMRHRPGIFHLVSMSGSMAIGFAGTFWFIMRLFPA